ncbi:MAG: helicase-related protein, partial [Myxococcota bacterium]
MTALPIDPLLPQIVETVREHGRLVLEAPPGAGKTTRVPPALAESLTGKILVLEPRRLAAKSAAQRVASERGETPGQTIGYRVRLDSLPGSDIEFVTEGVFLRMLNSGLRDVGCVVFDEFHERHLDSDLALALVRGRKDLPLLVMSATLDAEGIASELNAPKLRAEGRSFPVEIEHSSKPDDRRLEQRVASAVRSVGSEGGDILVFLPGVGEIERCATVLGNGPFHVMKLHGQLALKEQNAVFSPRDQQRVILSTNVAETSVTVDGVKVVIDSGTARIPSWDPASGLQRLSLAKVSKASAIQRAGRAGRTAPGRCIRLYSRSDYDAREEHGAPEILRADAAELVLTLLRHGKTPKSLSWIDAPSPAALERAEDLLRRLGATEHGKLSGRGQAMAELPLHPRLAALALNAAAMGHARTGALAAAIASERDFVPRGPARSIGTSDLSERIDLLAGSGTELEMRGYHRATMSRVKESARQIEKILPKERSGDGDFDRAVFRAFSDRLAQRVGEKDGQIEIRLAEGGRALLAPNSVVRDSQWLVALATEKRGPKGREQTTVALASAVEPEWIEAELADELEAVDELELAKGRIYRIEGFKFRALWIDSDRRPAAPDDSVRDRLVGELSKRELGAVFPEAEVERALGRLESAVESGILPETDLGRRLL